MPRNPDVSVIVPVYNAQSTIEECIDSLLALAFAKEEFEILLVDNGSTDGTSEIMARYRGKARVVYESKRGAAAARNKGLLNARGEVVAFTDADCVVDKDWLQQIVSPLKDHAIGIAGGRILSRRPGNAIEFFGEEIHDQRKAINVCQPPYVTTANWSSRLSVLKEVGFFDESFLKGQDADLAYRIVQSGYRLVFAPQAIVYHRNKRTLPGLFNEGYVHGYHSVKLLQKHERFVKEYVGERLSLPPPKAEGSDLSSSTRRLGPRRFLYWATFKLGKRAGKILGVLRGLSGGSK
jgi:glycosyltransferase involved in cell wall biosynthesis